MMVQWIVCSLFAQLNNYKLFGLFNDQALCNTESDESSLILKPPQIFSYLFSEFDNFMSYPNNPENCVNYYYYSINEIKNLKTCKDKKIALPSPLKYVLSSKGF